MELSREEQLERDLQQAALAGQMLLEKLKLSETQVERLRTLLDEKARDDEQQSLKAAQDSSFEKKYALLETKHKQLQVEHEGLKSELTEAEEEISVISKENERLARENKNLVMSRAATNPSPMQKSGDDGSKAETQMFQAASKEQLRHELLEAGMTQDKLEKQVESLEQDKASLESTVESLMRRCQMLADELEEARVSKSSSSHHHHHDGVEDNMSLNTSLADELGDSLMDLDTPPATPEKKASSSLFSDMRLVETHTIPTTTTTTTTTSSSSSSSGGGLFSDMNVKETDDRQYREYVYMSVTAVKIGMAIRHANTDKAERLLKLTPKQVYDKAIEKRVPLHQVHDFVRKYALAFVEQNVTPARPPPKQGLLARVLTTYFPSTDYLFRETEVVPNRGSELGSFLSKRGSFFSRKWQSRWFKLNSSLNVISYHVNPHVLNALGTIPLSEIASAAPVAGGMDGMSHVFLIKTHTGREYHLAAESVTIMNYWLDGIAQALADISREAADRRSLEV